MKKKLNVDSIQSELRGGSAFFPGYQGQDSPPPPTEEQNQAEVMEAPRKEKKTVVKPQPSRDTTTPRHHDTTVSRYHDTTTPQPDTDIFEVVRKAVKQLG